MFRFSRITKSLMPITAWALLSACATPPQHNEASVTNQNFKLINNTYQGNIPSSASWRPKLDAYYNGDLDQTVLPYRELITNIEFHSTPTNCTPARIAQLGEADALNPSSLISRYIKWGCSQSEPEKRLLEEEIFAISHAMLTSGSGLTPESAITLSEVDEAYALLSFWGWYIFDMEIKIDDNEELVYQFHTISSKTNKFQLFHFKNMGLLQRFYEQRMQTEVPLRTVSLITMRSFLESDDPSSLAFVARNLMLKQEYQQVVDKIEPVFERSPVLAALLIEAYVKLEEYQKASAVLGSIEIDAENGFAEGLLSQALLISTLIDFDEGFYEVNRILSTVDLISHEHASIYPFVKKLLGHPRAADILQEILQKLEHDPHWVDAIKRALYVLQASDHNDQLFAMLSMLIEENVSDHNIMYQMALLYRHGNGVEKDEAKAKTYYLKAANLDFDIAQAELGYLHQFGLVGFPKDIELAKTWYLKAIKQKGRAAQTALKQLARLHLSAQTEADLQQGIQYFQQAIALGSDDAYCELGTIYDSKFNNTEKAITYFREGARVGSVDCMFELGYIFESKLQDYDASRNWYEQAARAGDFAAMTNLGRFYDSGLGVKKDYVKAKQYYEAAIRGENLAAYVNLGLLYERGLGVEKDLEKAASLYEQAAKKGDDQALHNLGVMYANGHHFEENRERALQLYLQAADLGNRFSLYNVANAYRYGRGIDVDYTQAILYYEKALKAGLDDAICSLADMYRDYPETKSEEKAKRFNDLAKQTIGVSCF